jgi:hypothetical protein
VSVRKASADEQRKDSVYSELPSGWPRYRMTFVISGLASGCVFRYRRACCRWVWSAGVSDCVRDIPFVDVRILVLEKLTLWIVWVELY